MPLITGTGIAELVDLFEQRGVKFYHACQYKDFKSYLRLGGVPSRSLLSQNQLNYTRFDTDSRDVDNSVWDKVFGNLSDFGAPFFSGNDNTASVPPPFGPILLVFNPRVFMEANDIAICLRSAGAENFDRERESLSSHIDINNIFRHVDIDSSADSRELSYIKYNSELQQTFGVRNAGSPEISCSTNTGMLSLNYLTNIRVDPYLFGSIILFTLVRDRVSSLHGNFNIHVNERYTSTNTKREFTSVMVDLLSKSDVTAHDVLNNVSLPAFIHNYINRVHAYQFNRFAKYLREGTILDVLNEL